MNPFQKNTKQISIFVTAGFPEIESLPNQISLLEQHGIDFIEVGIPFSDPMADGPTIQHSSEVAIRNGMNIDVLFSQLNQVQSNVPLVIMSYFNPILHYGLEEFLQGCTEAGVYHIILPDVSLEVYDAKYRSIFEKYGIAFCFLATPKTSSERIAAMAERSSNGFLYLVSSAMTTGNNVKRLAPKEVERIRAAAGNIPIMIGFGIRNTEDVRSVHEMADGAIIGSAYIRALSSGNQESFLREITTDEAPAFLPR